MPQPKPERRAGTTASTGGASRRSGNPAARARAGSGSSPVRRDGTRTGVGSRSRALLLRLSALPRLVVPGVMLVLMLVGLQAPLPYALVALGAIAAFVLWLAYLSWPVLDARGRLLRGIMLGAVIGSAVGRIRGWL